MSPIHLVYKQFRHPSWYIFLFIFLWKASDDIDALDFFFFLSFSSWFHPPLFPSFFKKCSYFLFLETRCSVLLPSIIWLQRTIWRLGVALILVVFFGEIKKCEEVFLCMRILPSPRPMIQGYSVNEVRINHSSIFLYLFIFNRFFLGLHFWDILQWKLDEIPCLCNFFNGKFYWIY